MDTGKRIRVFRVSADSTAGLMVTPTSASLAGDSKNFIHLSDTGIVIMGQSISFATLSENMRVGGFFVGNNDIARMFPSTIVTPQSLQLPYPPLALASNITKDLPFALALLAGSAAAGVAG